MLAIFKRELKSYLHSFLGFLFIALILLFVGYNFAFYNVMIGYPYFYYTTSSSMFMFLILVPIITMRSMAEERKNKTDQLILTAPVTVGKIVMGKFLALLTLFAIPTAIISIYPLIIAQMGVVPMGEAYLSVLGFFLYGMTCLAIGLFASSLVETPIVAAIISFIILLAGYLTSSLRGMVYNKYLAMLLNAFDLRTPFLRLVHGVLEVDVVVYYISVTVLFLFLAVQSVQKRRYSVSVKTISVGAYSTSMIAVAIVLTIAVNVVVNIMPSTWTSIDFTYEQLYSLSDETKEFVDSMEEDVKIYVMVNKEEEDSIVGQTLELYDALSGHISIEYVDPTLNPKFHTQYTTESITTNSLIFVSEKRSKVIKLIELYKTTLDPDSGGYIMTGYDGEGQITSALAYVTEDEISQAYFVEGHGEVKLAEGFADAMIKQNVMLENISLVEYETIPEEISCLVMNAPVSDLTEEDYKKLVAYMENGGNIVINAGPKVAETPVFDKLLAYMGLEITEGTVVEENTSYFYQNPIFLLPKMSYSPYTKGVYLKDYNVLAPSARGIIVNEEAHEDIEYDQFLVTSDESFAKSTSLATNYTREEGDINGPFAIGLAAEKEVENGTATMVLYTSTTMFTDEISALVSNANQRIYANGVSNCVGNEVNIAIPAKSYSLSYLTVTQSQILLVGALVLLILPLTFIFTGLGVWIYRKRR